MRISWNVIVTSNRTWFSFSPIRIKNHNSFSINNFDIYIRGGRELHGAINFSIKLLNLPVKTSLFSRVFFFTMFLLLRTFQSILTTLILIFSREQSFLYSNKSQTFTLYIYKLLNNLKIFKPPYTHTQYACENLKLKLHPTSFLPKIFNQLMVFVVCSIIFITTYILQHINKLKHFYVSSIINFLFELIPNAYFL